MARAAITPPDLALARAAAEKQRAGKPLSVRESAALGKVQRAQDNRDRDRLCRTLPRGAYLSLASITSARADKHAAAHAIPCRGRTIDLAAVLTAFHGLLETAGPRLKHDPAGDATTTFRREKARLAQIQRQTLEGELLPRAEVHAAFFQIATIFRSAAATLASQWPEAADTLTESIDDAMRHPFFAHDAHQPE
jgi:hypothetical protein